MYMYTHSYSSRPFDPRICHFTFMYPTHSHMSTHEHHPFSPPTFMYACTCVCILYISPLPPPPSPTHTHIPGSSEVPPQGQCLEGLLGTRQGDGGSSSGDQPACETCTPQHCAGNVPASSGTRLDKHTYAIRTSQM